MKKYTSRQAELRTWQDRNFPRSRYEKMSKEELINLIVKLQCALGMAEEVGEVAHHILKGTQGIRDGRNGFNVDEITDGVADSRIYGTQLLSEFDVDAEETFVEVVEEVLDRDWIDQPEGPKKPLQGK